MTSAPHHNAPDGERRIVSVVFFDLVGSTALSECLDPEDLRELVAGYHTMVASAVARFGGFAAQFMGDGVMSFFGYPQAHEDDAERAVRAALEVTAEVARWHQDGAPSLQIRVGIATGSVVVGALGAPGFAQEHAAIGETPNLAARLQALAAPGKVVICAATRRIAGGAFALSQLGAHQLRGFSGLVPAWQVSAPAAIESRFAARHPDRLPPMVGRSDELQALRKAWHRARSGEGAVVLLTAEAGLGKSRLAVALQDELEHDPVERILLYCSPFHTASALHPFSAELARAAGFVDADDPEARIVKLEALLIRHIEPSDAGDGSVSVGMALLCELLQLPSGERFPRLAGDPQRARAQTLALLTARVERVQHSTPVLVVFEDAHWADPTSLELLDRLVALASRSRILLVVTCRPEFVPGWSAQPHVLPIQLDRLARADAADVVVAATHRRDLPAELVAGILDRADGVPLFLEELARAVLESDQVRETNGTLELAGPIASLALPQTLHGSLLARLDAIATGKIVAQIGAAIGREFRQELLAEVVPLERPELEAALDDLVRSGLLLRTSPGMLAFRHVLIQEATYATLLRARRRELHRAIALALEGPFAMSVAGEPETVARHFAAAEMFEPAVAAYVRAARLGLARSAHREVAAHCELGLELLARLDPGGLRDTHELQLQTALGLALYATRGHGTVAIITAMRRARALGAKLGIDVGREAILSALGGTLWIRGAYHEALEVVDEMLEVARSAGDRLSMSVAHRLTAYCLNCMGSYRRGLAHARETIALYDEQNDPAQVWRVNLDGAVTGRCQAALASWHLGRVAESNALANAALKAARALAHPMSLLTALSWVGMLAAIRRDDEALHDLVREMKAHPQWASMPTWHMHGNALAGWLHTRQSRFDEGIAALEETDRTCTAHDNNFNLSGYRVLLAEACLAAGRYDDALAATRRGIELAERTGGHNASPELWRLTGMVLIARSNTAACVDAVAAFERAIDVARQHESIMYEIRAATALAHVGIKGHSEPHVRRLLNATMARAVSAGIDENVARETAHALDVATASQAIKPG